jgi:DNA-directed RNA polymerase specialized sigma24 family protein
MRYKIHNAICIKDEDDRNDAKALIKEQIHRIERVVQNYPKNLLVDFHFNQDDRLNYSLSALINLKEGIVFVKEKGENIEGIIFSLFDKLKLQLSKKIFKERKRYIRRRRQNRISEFIDHFSELQESKKEESIELSNQFLSIILRDITEYIDRRLKSAEITSAIGKGKFNLQEILDEIYLIAYNRIPDIPEKSLQNTAWIYQIADEYLAELFQEVKFEKKNIERLGDLVDKDYASYQDIYTINADNKVIPLEDIDGYEELSQVYMAYDLFLGDTENSILDEITLKLNQQQINDIIKKEINKLPLFKRTIIDLFLIDQMDVDEISSIKNLSNTEVEAVISEVSKDLERKLLSQL